MKVWEGKGTFEALLASDPELAAVLPPAELSKCFDAARTLRHVDAIYARAFSTD
jgi:adenylosuccinate lyase